MRALPKELTFFAIMMKAPRPPMLLARADEGDGTGQLGPGQLFYSFCLDEVVP
jgi:hypothetical protein